MLFFGANIAENIDISANGGRVLFTRDVANVTMDLNDVETIDFRALGGADNIMVGDLSGTDVTQVNLDLQRPDRRAATARPTPSPSTAPRADDVYRRRAGDAGGVTVFGSPGDGEHLLPGGGERPPDAQRAGRRRRHQRRGLEAGGIQLTDERRAGDDILIGSEGGDLINGGDGNDTALIGAGDDVFVWNPGDDNDTLEGQAGVDTMLDFNGANIAENIDISANGGRVRFFRDVANVTMDLNDVE